MLSLPWRARDYASLGSACADYRILVPLLPTESECYVLSWSSRARFQQHRFKAGLPFWDTNYRNATSYDIGRTENWLRRWITDHTATVVLDHGPFEAFIATQGLSFSDRSKDAVMNEASMNRLLPVKLMEKRDGVRARLEHQIGPIDALLMWGIWRDPSSRAIWLQAMECFATPASVPQAMREQLGLLAIATVVQSADEVDREVFGGIAADPLAVFARLANNWQRFGIEWVVGRDSVPELMPNI